VQGLDIALVGKDSSGPDGPQFYGDPSILENNPVTAEVTLPFGSWQIAAVPQGGWMVSPGNMWTIRAFALLAAALVVLPILVAGWLFGERYGHLRDLKENEKTLQRVSRRLELALSTSRIGV